MFPLTAPPRPPGVEDPEPAPAMPAIEVAHLEKGKTPEVDDWKPGPKEYALMITLSVISLMVALDATILVPVLPTLAVELGGSATDAFWAGTSYLLACAVCQPFIAALSDIFGRKELLLTSVLFFTMGTALCAPIAKDFSIFFFGRAIQGIGGGGIITMGQVIFADIIPLRQRPKYFSIVLAAWALGSVLGPLIGGLFVQHVIWEWCFYINFPFCILGLVLVPIYVKLKTKKTSLMAKLARVDWVGSFLFTAGMTSFLIGISWAGIQFEWNSPQVIAPIVVGVFGIVTTFVWEVYFAAEPILRLSLFYCWSAVLAYACALFQGLIIFCILYYVPFYFSAVRFVTPTQAGLDVFPVTVFLLPGSIVVSIITSRIGRFRWAIWGGWVVSAIACGLFQLFDQHTSTPVWAVILAVFGIGMGMLLTSINVGIQAISHVEDAGRAAAMYAFMRTLGMSIGVAIGGTAFQNVMANKLDDLGLPEAIAHDAEAFVAQMAVMDPTDPIRVGALEAYVTGFHGVYWIVIAASIAGFILSLGIKKHSMDKELGSDFVLHGGRGSNALLIARDPATGQSTDALSDLTPPPKLFSPNGGRRRSGSDSDSTCCCRPGQTASVSGRVMAAKTVSEKHNSMSSVASSTAVAYYIEPGGGVTPVDILAHSEKEQQSLTQARTQQIQHQTQPNYEPQPASGLSPAPTTQDAFQVQHLAMSMPPEITLTSPSRANTTATTRSVAGPRLIIPVAGAGQAGSHIEIPYEWTGPQSVSNNWQSFDAYPYYEGENMMRWESAAPELSSRRETLEPGGDDAYLGRKSWS